MLKTIASLQGVNILSKEAQKKVAGGLATNGYGTCALYLPNGYGIPGSTFSAASAVSQGASWTYYGVSASDAQAQANAGGPGAHWCCTSCASASWYHPI